MSSWKKTAYPFLFAFCLLSLPQKKLTTLDIAANRVKKIENISHLTELQEFWVRPPSGKGMKSEWN
jgi:hypothetical protein